MAVKDKLVSLEVLKATTQADVSDLKSALSGSTEQTVIAYTYSDQYYDLSGQTVDLSTRGSSSFFVCTILECQKDDQFLLNVVGGNASRAYGFVDASYNILEVAEANATLTNQIITAPATTKYLIINDKRSGGTSYAITSIAARLKKLESTAVPAGDKIACYGDSLTYGYNASASDKRYPAVLSTLTGLTVYNYGVNGDASDQIVARQMGYPAWVNDMTIPATTTAVEINWYANSLRNNTSTVKTIVGDHSPITSINPVTIAGVSGSLSYTDGTVYFTRTTSGDAVTIDRPVPLVVESAEAARNCVQIYWVGTNGGWFVGADDADTRINKLLSQIDAMIAHNKTGKYMVLGLTYYYDFVVVDGLTPDVLDYALQRKYSNHFINVRRYMMEFGLSDAGISPTDADTTAISEGKVPPSLLGADGIHGTDKFYEIVANIVDKRGKELGYWD